MCILMKCVQISVIELQFEDILNQVTPKTSDAIARHVCDICNYHSCPRSSRDPKDISSRNTQLDFQSHQLHPMPLNCQRLRIMSPSRVFVQLSRRRDVYSTTAFDFLLPKVFELTVGHRFLSRFSCTKNTTRSRMILSRRINTKTLLKPRTDHDGSNMCIEITARASNRLKEIMIQDSNPNLALRINVENGGCHGFQYLMSLTTLPHIHNSGASTQDNSDQLKVSVSDHSKSPYVQLPISSSMTSTGHSNHDARTLHEDDLVFAADDGSGAKVVMNISSLEVLKGSKVDYTSELIGSQFKIVDNPSATSSCGCGASFDIKDL
ncbi:Iron-sulfur assembly protein 2 [Golovinomyces cichoracearum]|uniref:Iron-sulfur assembly protein 2 n=1 Tax=Golovinomyces cichoracearum TaxID=62708 RepID=A0A420ISM9_9PEZI|nr:Iron-sulfur assembly protein 2 [Golovinomyces cichoracearum]